MAEYSTRALADDSLNTLWSQYGEVLRLVDSKDVDINYITKILKRPVYKTIYRLLILNTDETVNREIPRKDIIVNSGNYNENYQNGQRRSINISLVNTDGKYTPSINTIWVHNKFRFDIGISFNGEEYWFSRGIYVLNSPTANHDPSTKEIQLSLSDKFAILEGKMGTLESTYEIPVDSNIQKAISDLLALDNGAGYPIDHKPIFWDRAFREAKMPYTLSKDAGSTIGEMILDVATILSAEVYYNSQGNLCFVSINETSLDTKKAIIKEYSHGENDYFGSSANYDFENVVNEVQVVGDKIDEGIYSAYVQNKNPLSPICIQRIGRRILYINDSAIFSDNLAKQRAAYELRKRSILNTTVNVRVAFNPLLFVNNLIAIDDEHYNFKRDFFLIQSISFNIGDDCQMNIGCSNIVNFNNRDEIII